MTESSDYLGVGGWGELTGMRHKETLWVEEVSYISIVVVVHNCINFSKLVNMYN